MNYIRPLKNTPQPIALSDSKKDALATALREASENARQAKPLHLITRKDKTDTRLEAPEELLFIL